MPDYSFIGLSAADFEDLACDLLSAQLGLRLQTFAAGPDGGIDLLHSRATDDHEIVVQCKHYARSGYPALKSAIRKKELPKLRRLEPSRYVLCTSVPLSPANKRELRDILRPHCHSLQDIHGADDLNTALRDHPEIETSHYKLWLTSVAVLDRILRSGAIIWNTMTRADIERKMSLFVETDAMPKASALLQDTHSCIISGIPGIGKTSLAQILALRLMEAGFELIAIRDDVDEAFEWLDASKKQLVYFDDFLGRSSIGDRLGKNEDAGIARLLQEAAQSRRLRVLLTTREYILQDALRMHEPLQRVAHEVGQCTVELRDYSRSQRARLLYNHLYFSGLSDEHIHDLVHSGTHRSIIDHANFSPRIVEWMTLGGGPKGVSPSEYAEAFLRVLRDPETLWEHAFENQISTDAQLLLFCLATLPSSVRMAVLRDAWHALRPARDLDAPIGLIAKQEFLKALKQCEGSFTLSESSVSDVAISFHNPSIQDYLNARIGRDSELALDLLACARYFEQLEYLVFLSADGAVEQEPQSRIIDSEQFWTKAGEVLVADPARLIVMRRGGGQRATLYRTRLDIGERLSKLGDWTTRASDSAASIQKVLCLMAQVCRDEGVESVATVGLLALLDLVLIATDDSLQVARDQQELLDAIRKRVAAEDDPESWEEWSEFVHRHEEVLDTVFVGGCRAEAESFWESAVEILLEEVDAAEELQDGYEQLERVAMSWSLETWDAAERVERRVHELRRREPELDYEGGIGTGRSQGRRESGSNDEIDRLFDSLRERDPG